MSSERLFLDTAYTQALLNRRDQYHGRALAFAPRARAASEIWVTEAVLAVLVEIGNAFSTINRSVAAEFIHRCYQSVTMRVVNIDPDLFARAVQLYEARRDKDWGLTDCFSFLVMWDHGLSEAVTTDAHFVQAGFRALLRDET